MGNQLVNRRQRRPRRRNLPAELKVEIVDCLGVENAVHFLANVPNRLIINKCAPRIRRMLKMIDQIVIGYARTLPTADSYGFIWDVFWHKYTPEMDIFLRYGAANCRIFYICHDTNANFVGYPANFFNDLIKHYYETKTPTKAVRDLDIHLPWTNPAPWPATLLQPQAREINVKELDVNNEWKWIEYILRNKHNPNIEFKLHIRFEGNARCYQQMTSFIIWRVKDVQCCGGCTIL